MAPEKLWQGKCLGLGVDPACCSAAGGEGGGWTEQLSCLQDLLGPEERSLKNVCPYQGTSAKPPFLLWLPPPLL